MLFKCTIYQNTIFWIVLFSSCLVFMLWMKTSFCHIIAYLHIHMIFPLGRKRNSWQILRLICFLKLQQTALLFFCVFGGDLVEKKFVKQYLRDIGPLYPFLNKLQQKHVNWRIKYFLVSSHLQIIDNGKSTFLILIYPFSSTQLLDCR